MRPLRLHIRNFRSIRQQDIELAPVTLVYGPSGTGKSSLIYAPLVLRNILTNPAQPLSSLLTLGLLSLGSLNDVAFDHNEEEGIVLGVSDEILLPDCQLQCRFEVALSRQNAVEFRVNLQKNADVSASLKLEAALPVQLQLQTDLNADFLGVPLLWSGTAWSRPGTVEPEAMSRLSEALEAMNRPFERLRKVSFAPLSRGFFFPQYSPVSFARPVKTHEELATLLASDANLEAKVSTHLERICGLQFRVRAELGTSIFRLQVIDPGRDLGTLLVNEGFGVNQLVYLLALALWKDTEILLVEEPEIHLHPSLVRNFALELARIARSGKQIVVSTHSEVFVSSLLAMVAGEELRPDEIACYFARRERGAKESSFERQLVNEHGQIEGGLKNFVETELENLRAFLGDVGN
jgi:predicted ATPase